MVCRLSAWKISEACRLVIKRVLEGGVGMERGGMVERSIDIGVRDSLDDGREERGKLSVDIWQ